MSPAARLKQQALKDAYRRDFWLPTVKIARKFHIKTWMYMPVAECRMFLATEPIALFAEHMEPTLMNVIDWRRWVKTLTPAEIDKIVVEFKATKGIA